MTTAINDTSIGWYAVGGIAVQTALDVDASDVIRKGSLVLALVPKNTCRALTSNYSLSETWNFQKEEMEAKNQDSKITCFNRRVHEINIGTSKLYKKTNKSLLASSLIDNFVL